MPACVMINMEESFKTLPSKTNYLVSWVTDHIWTQRRGLLKWDFYVRYTRFLFKLHRWNQFNVEKSLKFYLILTATDVPPLNPPLAWHALTRGIKISLFADEDLVFLTDTEWKCENFDQKISLETSAQVS